MYSLKKIDVLVQRFVIALLSFWVNEFSRGDKRDVLAYISLSKTYF